MFYVFIFAILLVLSGIVQEATSSKGGFSLGIFLTHFSIITHAFYFLPFPFARRSSLIKAVLERLIFGSLNNISCNNVET